MATEEDDTFDIDLYGDDNDAQDTTATSETFVGNGAEEHENLYDDEPGEEQLDDTSTLQTATDALPQESSKTIPTPSADPPPQQGTKRKASELSASPSAQPQQHSVSTPTPQMPSDPNATPALQLTSLHWSTTEEDLRAYFPSHLDKNALRDLRIAEHNQNGKSRGEAYLEFSSPQAAAAVKHAVETANETAQKDGKKRGPAVVVQYTAIGNPFRGAGGAGEKFSSNAGRGDRGGYSSRGQRGNFTGRAGFQQNRGGGYGGRGGYGAQQNGGASQWGMNGGSFQPPNVMGGGAGYGGMGMAGMNMGNFGGMMSMGRGGNMMGMMPTMMGNMMNMGGMGRGGMNGMGGMSMMGRGGWGGGGFPQQGYGNANGQQQQGNKRPRNE